MLIKLKYLLLPLVLLFAFLLRARMFLHGDFYYLIDQARDLLLTKEIVVNHTLTLIGARTGLGGLFHGPIWLYMIAPFFAIFGGNPFLTLVPLFIIVSLTLVLLGFFVGWRLHNYYFGLLLALILSVSSSLVSTVAYTTNAQMQPIVVILYLYATIEFIRGKDKFIILSSFLVGLGFQFESAFAVLLIFLTIFAVLLRGKLPSLRNILESIIAFILPLSTFILFDLRHQFLMTKSFIRLFGSPIKPLPGYEKYASITFRFLDRLLGMRDSLSAPLFSNYGLTYVLLLIIFVIPILLLLGNLLGRKFSLNKEYLFLLFSPLIIFGLYVFYPLPLWPHYLLPVSIFTIILSAYSIKIIYAKNIFLKCLVCVFLLLLILPALQSISSQYLSGKSYVLSSDGTYRNQLAVAEWVLNDSKGKESGYFVYSPGILTYNMDYLIWWVSKRDGYKTLTNQKLKITYLIMYPHLTDDMGAYTFWKKNVLRTNGKVILTKFFTGGITVQKLLIDKAEPAVDPNYYQSLIFR